VQIAVKKILVVVDYQNDFVNGTLGFKKAETLEGIIKQKIAEYRDNGHEVAFTFDTHSQDYLSTQEGVNLPVKHCIRGTVGWELYGEVKDNCFETDKRFEKPAFGSLELARYLEEQKYDSVELIGLVSNICVLSNAILAKAALPQAFITVDASAVASYDDKLNDAALGVMESMHIRVINKKVV
jgi:nicotinamidase-related amidase